MLANVYYATTAVNIAIDWYCALLPIPLLWHAPLDLRTKFSVAFLLSLGVLASVAACVRQTYTVALTSSHDVERSLGMLMIWGYAEVGIGFFVGSLSTLRPLFSSRRPTPRPKAHKMQDFGLPENPRIGRPREVVPTDVRRLSPAFRESEESVIRGEIFESSEMYHAR